jgi:hypothetical protein
MAELRLWYHVLGGLRLRDLRDYGVADDEILIVR